jgi:hypothetical protein
LFVVDDERGDGQAGQPIESSIANAKPG